MAKKTFICISLMLALVLILAGCGGGVTEEQYNTLKSQLDAAQKQLTTLGQQVNAANSELTSAKSEIQKQKTQITEQTVKLTQQQTSADAQQKKFADLEKELNAKLDTRVTMYYTTTVFQSRRYAWTLTMPLRAYFTYKDKSRPSGSSAYGTMAMDTAAESVVEALVRQVRDATLAYNLKAIDIVNLVGAFTQGLPHSNQDPATPYDNYARYPVETLFENGGDSEDNAILAAALLRRLDYNLVFLVFEQPKHVAIGVDVSSALGRSWEYQAKRYYVLETTGTNWLLGDLPVAYAQAQPTIVPVGK